MSSQYIYLFKIETKENHPKVKPETLATNVKAKNATRSANRNKSLITSSMSRPIENVISSSTEDDDDVRQYRHHESANMNAMKNAVNLKKGAPLTNLNNQTQDNRQMSEVVQSKHNSKQTALHSSSSKDVGGNKQPPIASREGAVRTTPSVSGVGRCTSLTNSPRSSSLASKKNGICESPKAGGYYSPSRTKKV